MARGRGPFTEEEWADIIRRRKAGEAFTSIAPDYDLAAATLRTRCKKRGLKHKTNTIYNRATSHRGVGENVATQGVKLSAEHERELGAATRIARLLKIDPMEALGVLRAKQFELMETIAYTLEDQETRDDWAPNLGFHMPRDANSTYRYKTSAAQERVSLREFIEMLTKAIRTEVDVAQYIYPKKTASKDDVTHNVKVDLEERLNAGKERLDADKAARKKLTLVRNGSKRSR